MDTLAEWSRPAKPMGSPRVGSNPTGVDFKSASIVCSLFGFGREKKSEPGACAIIAAHVASYQDSLAEWSKALALGASPQGRGSEPHSCHFFPNDQVTDS